MDDLTVLESLIGYGALGVVAVYFMVKDWKLNNELRNALTQFTVAINVLLKGGFHDEI